MKSLGGSECNDFQNYPSPHQELRSIFDSVFKGYFSDDLFAFSESQVRQDSGKFRLVGFFAKHKGNHDDYKKISPKSVCCYSEAPTRPF